MGGYGLKAGHRDLGNRVSVRPSHCPHPDLPRGLRLVDHVARPSSEASGRGFLAPCGLVSESLQTASEEGIADIEPGTEQLPQVSGTGTRLRLADQPTARDRSLSGSQWRLGKAFGVERRCHSTIFFRLAKLRAYGKIALGAILASAQNLAISVNTILEETYETHPLPPPGRFQPPSRKCRRKQLRTIT